MIKLRGHHLLCIHGFQGMGYNPFFIEKMQEVSSFMKDENLNGPVQVEATVDHVCQACPHYAESGCKSAYSAELKIREMDHRVLNHLGLNRGEVYVKNDLIQLTREKVTPEDLDYLCRGCSWLNYGVCKEGIGKLIKELPK